MSQPEHRWAQKLQKKKGERGRTTLTDGRHHRAFVADMRSIMTDRMKFLLPLPLRMTSQMVRDYAESAAALLRRWYLQDLTALRMKCAEEATYSFVPRSELWAQYHNPPRGHRVLDAALADMKRLSDASRTPLSDLLDLSDDDLRAFARQHENVARDIIFPSLLATGISYAERPLLREKLADKMKPEMDHPMNAEYHEIIAKKVHDFMKSVYTDTRRMMTFEWLANRYETLEIPNTPKPDMQAWRIALDNMIPDEARPISRTDEFDTVHALEEKALHNILVSRFVREDIVPLLEFLIRQLPVSRTGLCKPVKQCMLPLQRDWMKNNDDLHDITLVGYDKIVGEYVINTDKDEMLRDTVRAYWLHARNSETAIKGFDEILKKAHYTAFSIVLQVDTEVINKWRQHIARTVKLCKEQVGFSQQFIAAQQARFRESVLPFLSTIPSVRMQKLSETQLKVREFWHTNPGCSCNEHIPRHAVCLIVHGFSDILKKWREGYVQFGNMIVRNK